MEIGFWHATLLWRVYGIFQNYNFILSAVYSQVQKELHLRVYFLWSGRVDIGKYFTLYYKKIIDVISLESAVQNKEAFLMVLFIKLALLILAYNLFFRAADFFMLFFQSNMLRDLRNYAFDKTTEHSYTFFQIILPEVLSPK